MEKWKTISSEYVVNDRYLRVRADSCRTPDGKVIEPYYVLENGEWVNAVVFTKENKAVMVQQYRHGVGEYELGLVGGGAEEGEPAEVAMRRELLEEIGYSGGTLLKTGVTYANAASHNNRVHSFLAVGGQCDSRNTARDEGEGTMRTRLMPIEHFFEEILASPQKETFQALHLAGIFLAFNKIRSSGDPLLAPYKKYL